MPNHCGNQLTILGDKLSRDQFVNDIAGSNPQWGEEIITSEARVEKFCLNQIMPVPRDVIEAGFNNGYDWCVDQNNWGTKWGCYDTKLEHDANSTKYIFLTAWSPFSEAVFELLTSKYPTLTFRLIFAEKGCQYYGCYDSHHGYFTEKFEESDIKQQCACDNPYDCPCEKEEVLLNQLSEYQDVYNMSG
jgi:Ferredoxin-like domain in Api92-like protein